MVCFLEALRDGRAAGTVCRRAHAGELAKEARVAPPRYCMEPRLLVAPTVVEAKLGVLAVDTVLRFVGDQRDARVVIAGDLLAGLRVVDTGLDAERSHLQRILLRRCGDRACLHIAHAFT